MPVAAFAASPPVSQATFEGQIAAAQQMLNACSESAEACVPGKSPPEERVSGAGREFAVHWQWFSEVVERAKAQPNAQRAMELGAARRQLDELLQQSRGATAISAGEFAAARATATSVLARDEFRAASAGTTWLDRQIARVQDWFLRAFVGLGMLGAQAPWIAPALAWGCFLLVTAGLLYFVRQNLARQALRVSLGSEAARARAERTHAEDWERLAREEAARGAWREAVHALYWAAIARLEARRAWKTDAARTPREYLRLLGRGSAAEAALRGLTRSLERVWYGSEEAEERDFHEAQARYDALTHSDLREGSEKARVSPARPAAEGA